METKSQFQEKLSKLFAIAESQQGLFTAKQAEDVGFLATNFTYHVRRGMWIREGRGIYRLKNFPQDQVKAQYTYYWLWSRDRNDKPQGVFSHETALSIYELSDVMPAKIHMTVPTGFRKWAETPKVLILHYRNLEAKDYQTWEGLQITKPIKTILDLIHDQTTSMEFVEQAYVEGYNRGIITHMDLDKFKVSKELRNTFEIWLKDYKRKTRRAAL